MNINRILILGGRSYVALEMARNWGKQGIEIHVGDCFKNALTMHSTYTSKAWVYPSPRFETEEFKKTLVRYVEKEQIDFVVPTCEEHLYVSEINKEWLDRFVFIDTIDKNIKLHDKETFIDTFMNGKFPVPITCNGFDFLDKQFVSESGKYVLKQKYSRFATNVHILNKLNTIQFLNNINIISTDWVVQEYLDGKHFCSTHYFKNGEIITGTIYPSEIKVDNGATLYFDRINHHKLLKSLNEMGKLFKWNGFYSFDWIETTKGLYSIECNIRPTSGVHLFSQEDFALIIGNKTYGTTNGDSYEKKSILHALWLKPSILLKHFNMFKTSKDVLSDKKDKSIYLGLFKMLLHFIKLKLKTKRSLTGVSTYDLEYVPLENRK